jgi:uncharacterized membrane protein
MIKSGLFAFALLAGSANVHAEVKGLSCFGTEPFYTLDIDVAAKKLTYRNPATEQDEVHLVFPPLHADGLPETGVMVFKGRRTDVNVTVISDSLAGKCTDGMSEGEYAYHVVYTNGHVVKYGCCEPKAQD